MLIIKIMAIRSSHVALLLFAFLTAIGGFLLKLARSLVRLLLLLLYLSFHRAAHIDEVIHMQTVMAITFPIRKKSIFNWKWKRYDNIMNCLQ